jgi:hypothetical protein
VTRHGADIDRRAEWDDLRARYLAPTEQRPPSTARGVHHLALLSHDVEKTIAAVKDCSLTDERAKGMLTDVYRMGRMMAPSRLGR